GNRSADRRYDNAMTVPGVVLLTTFLAAAIEAVEMVTIVVGVGAVRGYRYSLLGAAGGLLVLAVVVVAGGYALAAIPIGPLRVVVGSLLLLFGLDRKSTRLNSSHLVI